LFKCSHELLRACYDLAETLYVSVRGGAAGGRHPGGREEGSEGEGMGKKDFRNFQRRHRSTPRKAKDEGGKSYYRSEAAGPIQKPLKNNDPNNTRWSQDERPRNGKSFVHRFGTCTEALSSRLSLFLSLSLSLSLFCLSFSLALRTTQHKTNKQTNKQTTLLLCLACVLLRLSGCCSMPVLMSTRARAGWRAAGWGREGGREGRIPPRRFQNPYIKCVGPGIKDP